LATDPRLFESPPPSGLRVTWLGHSTTLIEIEGRRFLTDPVFGKRASPSTLAGPARFFAPPLPLERLPEVDAVLISHDHYDHLDYRTLLALAKTRARFVVPLGVGAHLERWGVIRDRIDELDWWERVRIAGVELVAAPTRHFSGRGVADRNSTLWTSWALLGSERRVYFGGDSGPGKGFAEIGERLGPFDLTMLEIGASDPMWPLIHLGPAAALEAHQALRGRVLLPIHWATFNLALHAWFEPGEELAAGAAKAGARVAFPRPGESFEPTGAIPEAKWWSPASEVEAAR
jgi:L-ascorbate metabolism protein UlaG (beta-lactamase superfamily)